jgi:hypothetical protein
MPLKDLLGKAVRSLSRERGKRPSGPDRLMPMREAAEKVYNALDGTTFPMNHTGPMEARLASMATMLAARIPVRGARASGGTQEEVPREEFRLGMFRDCGNAFRRHAEPVDAWVELAVMESDVNETIRQLVAK